MGNISQSESRAIAVILAAGEGRRMGLAKALLLHSGGQTFLEHLASLFEAQECRVLAVVGHEAKRVGQYHRRLELVENTRWQEGQWSSAQFGIQEALARGALTVLVHPVDVPNIHPATVGRLLEAASGSEAVVPEYEAEPGHPLVLSGLAAERVLRSQGPHLEAALQAVRVRCVAVDDPGVCLNINTPADYERAFGRAPTIPSP
jgi:CTP:molybdopterin cytidylyltransferase MocA